jgi:glycine oxidase
VRRRSFLVGAGLGLLAARRAWGGVPQETFDVVVVGAGMIGATTAWFLRREGLRVALLDRGPAGREASWASAGMIQPYGPKDDASWSARAVRLSRELYEDLEPRLFEETGRRIGYGGEGGLVIAFEDGEADALRRIARTRASDDPPAEFLTGAEARKRDPGLSEQVAAAVLLPAHRYLDARACTATLVEAARKLGVDVREGAEVTGFLRDGEKVVGVQAGTERIRAGTVVVTAGAWSGKVDPKLTLPVRPVHGQILSIEGPKGGLRHNLQRLGAGGYATPRADGRVVVGATSEDFGFEKKVTAGGLAALSAMVRDLLPHLADRKVLDVWSGLRPGSPDGLPAVGPDPRAPGLFWAAGHGGYGMMQGPATAQAVADLVLKRKPRLAVESVDPARFVR